MYTCMALVLQLRETRLSSTYARILEIFGIGSGEDNARFQNFERRLLITVVFQLSLSCMNKIAFHVSESVKYFNFSHLICSRLMVVLDIILKYYFLGPSRHLTIKKQIKLFKVSKLVYFISYNSNYH